MGLLLSFRMIIGLQSGGRPFLLFSFLGKLENLNSQTGLGGGGEGRKEDMRMQIK